MVKKGNFNRAPLGCFFKIYRYWYTDRLLEVKFYFVSEHLPDDSDKLAGTVPKGIVVRPAFGPLGVIISLEGCVALGFSDKTSQDLKLHHVKVIETDESEGILHHKSFSNYISVDLICLRFANVILMHLTGFDGVQHIHLLKLSNKLSNKVVIVVCRRLKTDDAVLVE